MKSTTINGMTVPQFETIDVFRDSDTDNVNEKVTAIHANNKIRDYFSKRVCVNCKFIYFGEYEEQMICNSTALRFVTANQNPETFSCAAFEEKT